MARILAGLALMGYLFGRAGLADVLGEAKSFNQFEAVLDQFGSTKEDNASVPAHNTSDE